VKGGRKTKDMCRRFYKFTTKARQTAGSKGKKKVTKQRGSGNARKRGNATIAT